MLNWSNPPLPRQQMTVSCPDMELPADAPIRIVGRLLDSLDWSSWEGVYNRRTGQPPIHPKNIAGAILYGLMIRIHSSRQLEEATRQRIDMRWFLEGRTIDHTTFANFHTHFKDQINDLNKQFCQLLVNEKFDARKIKNAQTAPMDGARNKALEMIIDGTRIRANSDRHGARKAESIQKTIDGCADEMMKRLEKLEQVDAKESLDEERIAELTRQVEELQAQSAEREEAEKEEDKPAAPIRQKKDEPLSEDPATLARELEALDQKVKKYQRALEVAMERDAIKKAHGMGKSKTRVPINDPDSSIMPNKEGGYAPNYTPLVGVDGQSGAIISATVLSGNHEAVAVATLVDDCRETLGQAPDRVLADSNFAEGQVLEKLENDGIDAYMPAGFVENNPALRPDLTRPVEQNDLDKLPKTADVFAPAAFIYDAEKDCYFCPAGARLDYETTKTHAHSSTPTRRYGCPGKAGCPLAEKCVKSEKTKKRVVYRDIYQEVRDRTNARMATDEGKEIFKNRAPKVEGVFAHIKQAMGVRQFLLRGLEKVNTEFKWICGAYNLKKLITKMALASRTGPFAPNSGPGGPSGRARKRKSKNDSCKNGFCDAFLSIYRQTTTWLTAFAIYILVAKRRQDRLWLSDTPAA